MKINSLSKAVLTAMLISGTLATTTPIHAAAETPSAVTEVNTQQTTGADVQATIVTNDDGTKTVKVTIPADQVVDSSAKNGTFTATTNDDTTAEVDSGSVKQTKNKIKFNVELNKDALSNEKLLTEDLTITISDSKGNEIGKISELTLQDLLASSEDGVSESSSSTAESSSQSTKEEASTSSPKAESSSAKNESSDAKTSSSAESSSDKAPSASSNTSESGSKAESSSTAALAPDTPANDTATSTADAGSTANSNGQSNQANSSSSNSDQNVTSFKSVKEMEQYASQHGNSSVNGKTVTTSVQEVEYDGKVTGNFPTAFVGDESALFESQNSYKIFTGETVTVKIASYTPSDNDNPAQIEFTDLQQVNGSSSADQPGQSGNAPTATTLPQTGNDRNDGVVQSGVGIFGLVSAAVAALGLRKRN